MQYNIVIEETCSSKWSAAIPEASDRYGFGISDHVADAETGVVRRGEARMNIALLWRSCSATENELVHLSKINSELDRLGSRNKLQSLITRQNSNDFNIEIENI
ncbi:hypothetical protein EON65_33350 [archaeon]|nr:MAG: hypothetical protein EON65_33350 [archaeon]